MIRPRHVVLVPVKPPARGKSRLAGMPEDQRSELAAAFALDTISAVLRADRVAEVLSVTDDFRFAARLTALGSAVVPDGVSGDLNATLVQAAAEARRRWPALLPVVVCADLPALVPAELDAALEAAGTSSPGLGRAVFVADAAGAGTTVYAACHEVFDPGFGVGSRAGHLRAGALELHGDFPTVRRDVDDADDLRGALALGVGPHTLRATRD